MIESFDDVYFYILSWSIYTY